MKKLYVILGSLFPVMILFASCAKQSARDLVVPISSDIVVATIAPNQSYHLNLANSGNVSIVKQALHYTVSKTELDTKTGMIVYQYLPSLDYVGTEEVVLSNAQIVNAGNSGCNSNHSYSSGTSNSTYKTIRLTIGN
jgi:hypothetical protein